ncbi:MAG: methylenetetrahydrofolate reductase C-terminal domain-containing protein [Geminicoccaceae bacterium]
MYAVRLWSIRHAGFWEWLYRHFERAYVAAGPALKRVGFARLEAPAAAIERTVKGLLFDCQMCGTCVLSSTGMSCPMNCPKQMRNGPCGGVRANGHCEVKPEMLCVWVQAWEGSRRMQARDAITLLQPPVDHGGRERSSWLRVVRERLGEPM